MELSKLTSRELFADVKVNPRRKAFGFGQKPALVNVDMQKAYTLPDEYPTAYETDPNQCAYVNELAKVARDKALPVAWTYVAYMLSGEDAGPWGLRSDTPDSLQNIKLGSRRAELDDRLFVDYQRDIVINKKMASAFCNTDLAYILHYNRVDTVIVTGGSTSGCVRATAVDSLSHGFRTIVPEECVSDRHEGPHFASLYDMALKYADVLSYQDVLTHLQRYQTPA